jgi:hypothetical protein
LPTDQGVARTPQWKQEVEQLRKVNRFLQETLLDFKVRLLRCRQGQPDEDE